MPPLIDARNLSRRFGPVVALADVTLRVERGEVVLLLGANGAGKTTLIRILAGLTRPDRGTVRIAGADLAADPAARQQVGLLSHLALMYQDLTPRENLRFVATLHHLDAIEERVQRALEDVGLEARADRPVRGFSRGMLQRLALARATLHAPTLLLLDEPFTGLDPLASRTLAARIAAERRAGRTVVAVSHDPSELWTEATRVVLLAAGRVVRDAARPEDLAAFRDELAAVGVA
jgi:heme exporter protein A